MALSRPPPTLSPHSSLHLSSFFFCMVACQLRAKLSPDPQLWPYKLKVKAWLILYPQIVHGIHGSFIRWLNYLHCARLNAHSIGFQWFCGSNVLKKTLFPFTVTARMEAATKSYFFLVARSIRPYPPPLELDGHVFLGIFLKLKKSLTIL